MFNINKAPVPKKEIFVVFIALEDAEGIPEYCVSRDEMMKKYFKYADLIQKEKYLCIDDATIKTEIIRYVRWIIQ